MAVDGITGVRIIPIHNGKCLFQHRDNKPDISHPDKWSFVSGGIEEGESYEEAIRRECIEEIGIDPSDLRYLGRSDVSASFCAYLTDQEVRNLVLGEGQEIRFFDPREMKEMNMSPKLEELVIIHIDNLERLIRGEAVAAEELGLLK